METKRQLSAAICAADVAALVAHLAHYYIGLAAWHQARATDGDEALAFLNLAVASAEAALRSRRDFADARQQLEALPGVGER